MLELLFRNYWASSSTCLHKYCHRTKVWSIRTPNGGEMGLQISLSWSFLISFFLLGKLCYAKKNEKAIIRHYTLPYSCSLNANFTCSVWASPYLEVFNWDWHDVICFSLKCDLSKGSFYVNLIVSGRKNSKIVQSCPHLLKVLGARNCSTCS